MADEPKSSRQDQPWTDEEVARLRELVPTHIIREIAATLERSPRSVRGKMGSLGLSPYSAWMDPGGMERRRTAARERYARNRDAIKAERARYYRTHASVIRARRKVQRALRRDPAVVAAAEAAAAERRRSAPYRKYLRAIARLYGITREQYEAKLAEQDGCCAICREDRPLSVDHDHLTGDFRGLLCHRCNIHLRVLEEEERWLAAARAYLAR